MWTLRAESADGKGVGRALGNCAACAAVQWPVLVMGGPSPAEEKLHRGDVWVRDRRETRIVPVEEKGDAGRGVCV